MVCLPFPYVLPPVRIEQVSSHADDGVACATAAIAILTFLQVEFQYPQALTPRSARRTAIIIVSIILTILFLVATIPALIIHNYYGPTGCTCILLL